jgi:SAM-dependent methyltransferase
VSAATVGSYERLTREAFTRQAPRLDEPGSSFGARGLERWCLRHLPCRPDDAVLDVAGGAGHLARALAPHVAHVTVLDLTPAMLEAGRHAAARAGIANVAFEQGAAVPLPYPDASFDLVVSRFAFHHLADPLAALGEMARVARPGGAVAVVDLIALDERIAPDHDRIERLRDPSHARVLTLDALMSGFARAGLTVEENVERDQPIEVEPWLRQACTPAVAADEVRAALAAEADGGAPTGLRAGHAADTLQVTQRWALVRGSKPEIDDEGIAPT